MHRPLPDHLAAERLAALADDELTTGEAGHIYSCDLCAGELNAHRHLRALARDDARRLGAPLTRWGALAPRLREEGLIRATLRATTGLPGVRRVAAAVVLVAGGVLAGRVSAHVGAGRGIVDSTASIAD